MSEEEYAKWYGASDKDIKQVREFLESGKGGLDVVEVHPASRTIVAKGTVSQVEKLFGITLNEYSLTGTGEGPEGGMSSETYRSHEDPLTVRTDLADVIVGVFGLHTRSMVSSSGPNSPNNTSKAASPNTVPAVMQHYNFPTDANGKPLRATGETIGIFAPKYKSNTSIPPGNEVCGYAQSDIDKYYQTPQLSHLTAPTICVQSVDGTVNSPQSPDPEVTQDICIASSVAQGAKIVVYLNSSGDSACLAVVKAATFPKGDEPAPSVLSISFTFTDGDDPSGLGDTPESFLTSLSSAFEDAGARGVTICVSSGDYGAAGGVPPGSQDRHQRVQYPASDPWILACGGTRLAYDSANSLMDYVWNDADEGATGGGISAQFGLPNWQSNSMAKVPNSMVDGKRGRGVPDVAANASLSSAYKPIFTTNQQAGTAVGAGTSAAAPLYAGLIAILNSELGKGLGFVNASLYQLGSTVCENVSSAVTGGLPNNTYGGVEGYQAGPGWNACTGWGTINGKKLLDALQNTGGS